MIDQHDGNRPSRVLVLCLALGFGLCGTAESQDRMPPVPAEKMTEAQKQAVAEFIAARGGTGVGGVFSPLLRSPDLLNRVRAISDYVRFKSPLPPRIRELVILFTVREWTLQLEWPGHSRLATEAGLTPETIRALAEGRRPHGMAGADEVAYDFCLELRRNQSISDVTYARAVSSFGEQGIIDMIGLTGYYSLLGMLTNTARTALPAGRTPELLPLPR